MANDYDKANNICWPRDDAEGKATGESRELGCGPSPNGQRAISVEDANEAIRREP